MKRSSLFRVRNVRGFTIAEMMVVVVLLGIIAALTVPRMGGMVERQRIDGATRQLTQDIGFARADAVRSGQPTRVVIEANQYRIFRGAAATPIRTVQMSVDYPGVQLTPAELQFNTRGLLQAGQAVNLDVKKGPRSKAVQVLPTGRVYHAY